MTSVQFQSKVHAFDIGIGRGTYLISKSTVGSGSPDFHGMNASTPSRKVSRK
jgi:hypothetical protein